MLSLANQALEAMYDNGYRFIKGRLYGIKGKPMHPHLKDGYYFIKLKVYGNKYVNIAYHRVKAFKKYGKRLFEPSVCVRHLDGNSLNNKLGNLMIGTTSDNRMDIPKNLRIKSARAASSRNYVFPDEVIIDIVKMRKNGARYKDIQKKYPYAKSTLSFFFNESDYVKRKIYELQHLL